MSRIHPTAIIEPGAELADDVEIGPYAIVGANVTIGAGTVVGSHSVIEGHTTIGCGNRIGHYASVGGRPQDMKYQGEPTKLVIGDRNTIREFTTIHTGTVQDGGVTRVGDDNWIMAYVHIGHDCQVGSHVVLSSNAQMAGHVIVGDWAIIGGMSGVHQFVKIGEHAMLGGASALVQDIPPFVIAAGNKAEPHGINVEGLRRRGFSADAISALRSAYRLLYKNGLSLEDAKAQLAELASAGGDGDEYVRKLIGFIETSQRGIIR
jgi:UDP-N-acetylglucosamine acyltransferase